MRASRAIDACSAGNRHDADGIGRMAYADEELRQHGEMRDRLEAWVTIIISFCSSLRLIDIASRRERCMQLCKGTRVLMPTAIIHDGD